MPFGGASEKAPPIGQWSHGRAIIQWVSLKNISLKITNFMAYVLQL